MNGQFHGKNVLVTGAANGVGLATAQAFASEGAQVFAADIDDARGEATVRAIVDGGGAAEFVHADMASADSIDTLFARILARGGRLARLIHGAASFWWVVMV
jgi:NAD(P)-dependent dehydrogenase (short-subunit alcohol dehydrogenase family)